MANPDFFKGLNALLASTDLDTIKTYLRWQLINSTPEYALPKAFDDEHFDFYGRKLRGQPEQRARWKRCVAGHRRRAGRGSRAGLRGAGVSAASKAGHRSRWCTTSRPPWTRTSTLSTG